MDLTSLTIGYTLPCGYSILNSWEDEDRNRIFIVSHPGGHLERWVRCGQYGVWLERSSLHGCAIGPIAE